MINALISTGNSSPSYIISAVTKKPELIILLYISKFAHSCFSILLKEIYNVYKARKDPTSVWYPYELVTTAITVE